jgi:hypothetical protein
MEKEFDKLSGRYGKVESNYDTQFKNTITTLGPSKIERNYD